MPHRDIVVHLGAGECRDRVVARNDIGRPAVNHPSPSQINSRNTARARRSAPDLILGVRSPVELPFGNLTAQNPDLVAAARGPARSTRPLFQGTRDALP